MAKGRAKGWKPAEHGKNPGGRPVEWTDEIIEAMGDRLVEWAQGDTSFYLETFCKIERTYPQKLSELAGKNKKFAEDLKIAKAASASNFGVAMTKGLIPPAVGVFGLKQHGHTDKQEVAHSGEVRARVAIVNLPPKAPI